MTIDDELKTSNEASVFTNSNFSKNGEGSTSHDLLSSVASSDPHIERFLAENSLDTSTLSGSCKKPLKKANLYVLLRMQTLPEVWTRFFGTDCNTVLANFSTHWIIVWL